MSFATLIVHAEANAECEPRLNLAAELANQFDATLIGIGAEMVFPVGLEGEYATLDGELLVAESKAVQSDLQTAESRFREVAKTVQAGSEWRSGVALPNDALVEESRAADLIVSGPRGHQPYGFQNKTDPGELMLRSGRPVLVSPDELAKLDASSILIAWKDTREARRAVADALPFLKRATQVLVAEVCEHKGESAAEEHVADVADFLARHEIRASTAVRSPLHQSAAMTLLEMAEMQDAGLIVCGGFGHARLREWVFGGVTQELLWSARKPVLFSH